MQGPDSFLGLWRLDPAESNYSKGQPPASATYEIARTSAGYRFTAHWTMPDGSVHEVSFEGVADGEDHPAEAGDMDGLRTLRVDKRRLDTHALRQGQVVHRVVREVSQDSQTMKITQAGPSGSGGEFRNVAVYRRV